MPLAPVKNRAKLHESKKARAIRRIRTLAIASTALVLVVGGMLAVFIWLMKPPTTNPPVVAATEHKAPDLGSHKIGPNVPIGSAIQAITSPITPGSNANVTLRTTEGAVCSLKVVRLDPYAKELEHVTDSGITDKTADDFGMVTWTWTMPETATIGTWKADMFCKRDSMSTQSAADIVVQKQ